MSTDKLNVGPNGFKNKLLEYISGLNNPGGAKAIAKHSYCPLSVLPVNINQEVRGAKEWS